MVSDILSPTEIIPRTSRATVCIFTPCYATRHNKQEEFGFIIFVAVPRAVIRVPFTSLQDQTSPSPSPHRSGAQSNQAHSTLLTQNWTGWVGFTPRTARNGFAVPLGQKLFMTPVKGFFLSLTVLISLLVGQPLSKQGESC